MPPYHVVEGRIILTWGVPWPQGVLTGVEDHGGFYLEHVVAFAGTPPGTLGRVLSAGLTEAWRRGYAHVVFCVPQDHPIASGLFALAERYGFTLYAGNAAFTWWIKRKPA